MLRKCYCFEIKVKCTNALRATFRGDKCGYMVCEDGIIHVCTNDIRSILDLLGEDVILEIKRLGIGYIHPAETEYAFFGKPIMENDDGQKENTTEQKEKSIKEE